MTKRNCMFDIRDDTKLYKTKTGKILEAFVSDHRILAFSAIHNPHNPASYMPGYPAIRASSGP